MRTCLKMPWPWLVSPKILFLNDHEIYIYSVNLTYIPVPLTTLFFYFFLKHIGLLRLNNIQDCVEYILKNNIPGDFIETGSCKGGAVIFMRACLKAHGITNRKVYSCDTFSSPTPPGNFILHNIIRCRVVARDDSVLVVATCFASFCHESESRISRRKKFLAYFGRYYFSFWLTTLIFF